MILQYEGKAYLINKDTAFFYQNVPPSEAWQFGIKNGGFPSEIISTFEDEEDAENFYKKVQKALKRGEKVIKV